MNIILAKSPFIKQASGTGVVGGKVEIFLWKQGTTEPTTPQYTLSKLSPASNVNSVYFDVAPYINEFLTNKTYTVNYGTIDVSTNTEIYTNVRIKTYKLIGTTYTLIDNITYTGFKGYLYQNDGINNNYDRFLLDQKTYYYHYDSSKDYITLPAGDLTLYNNYNMSLVQFLQFKYTNLANGNEDINMITNQGWKTIYRVFPDNWADGNKLEILDQDDVVLATYYFKPIEECRYSPVTLDFINKYGAWQREFLFKNSTDTVNVEGQQYKNYRSIPNVYNAQENLVTTFNTNGTEAIKCNTGWVNEDFKDTIKQLLLSDRILINNKPATITTKQIDLQKNINNKLINYSLDFQFSNNLI